MAKLSYNSALQTLKSRKQTTVCNDLKRLLEDLGYEVDKAARGNHFTFTNVDLGYYGGNYDCGHGRNPEVLPRYIEKIIKILTLHDQELREKAIAQEQQNDGI